MKVSFRQHISIIFSCLWICIYANSIFLLGMPDGDAMEGKLFYFLRYLVKHYPSEQHLSTTFHCKHF
jgi:hypothetical protein